MVAVDRSRDGWPRVANGQNALDRLALLVDLLAGSRVEQNRVNAEERQRRGPGLGLGRTRQRRDDDAAGLGLPVRVDDGALARADVLVVPHPRVGRNGFADRPDRAEAGQIVVLDVMFTHLAEEADRSRRGVELGQLVLLHGLPVAGWVRVDRGRFKDCGRNAQHERSAA
jgi:hypothetical protein